MHFDSNETLLYYHYDNKTHNKTFLFAAIYESKEYALEMYNKNLPTNRITVDGIKVYLKAIKYLKAENIKNKK